MKRFALAVLAGLAALGCNGREADEAPTGAKSQDKFEMSGNAGADTTGGGGNSAKAGSESESSDN